MKTRDFGEGIDSRNNPKLIVVKSNENSGKTTTVWMVLYELLSRGATIRSFKDYSGMTTPPTSMPPVGSLYDFEAEVDWNGKYIILFSHGDDPTFVQKLMNAALIKNPTYIVCASRSQDRDNSTWRLFKNTYTNLRFARVCLWSEYTDNPAYTLLVKQPTVDAIVNYII